MSEAESPQTKHEFVLVDDLFKEIVAGRLRIPRFQRPFVWKPSDIVELFESLQKGYPIGSLLFWETDQAISSADHVGPIGVKARPDGAIGYVLDGQQRLSTLFGVLSLPPDYPKGPAQADWRWWLYYDLKGKKFLHLPPKKVEPHVIPMRALLRTVDFIKEAKRIQAALKEQEQEAESLIEEGQILAQQIRGYKITVVRIRGGSLSEGVEIFSRLNTRGSKITKDQMLSALTYKEGGEAFDLAKHLDELTDTLAPLDMGHIRRLVLYRVVLAAAGSADVYRGEWADYNKKTAAELSQIVSRARASLLAAIQFLRNDLEIPSDSLLPYSSCLIPLSELFRSNPSPSADQRAQLKRWFWATSFLGVFASINSTSMAIMLQELRAFGSGEIARLDAGSVSDRARPFPARFDMHSARLRVLLLIMLRRLSPRDAQGRVIDSAQVIREYGSAAFRKVFTAGSDATVAHPANRVFLGPLSSLALRKTISEIEALDSPMREQVLDSHAITEEALSALLDDDADSFIRLRKQTLIQVEREFLRELGIPAPDATFESDDVDADDEGL